jgi:hypothetical protein
LCYAIPERIRAAADLAPHCGQDDRTGGRHQRVRRLSRTVGYRLSQRARKKMQELWGKAKCWHVFRRVQRRGLRQVRDEAYLMSWPLNLKRLAYSRPQPRGTRELGGVQG